MFDKIQMILKRKRSISNNRLSRWTKVSQRYKELSFIINSKFARLVAFFKLVGNALFFLTEQKGFEYVISIGNEYLHMTLYKVHIKTGKCQMFKYLYTYTYIKNLPEVTHDTELTSSQSYRSKKMRVIYILNQKNRYCTYIDIYNICIYIIYIYIYIYIEIDK